MTLTELQAEIARLPALTVQTSEGAAATATAPENVTPLDIVARQGRIILRLTAAMEALDTRYKELDQRLAERDAQVEALTEARRESERKNRQTALETIRLMDTLDWVHMALTTREDTLANEVTAARRDCLRRLAAVGITEIGCEGLPDGRLHEGVDSIETSEVPQYHIVSVVRRGYQWGADILRRAEVITAA